MKTLFLWVCWECHGYPVEGILVFSNKQDLNLISVFALARSPSGIAHLPRRNWDVFYWQTPWSILHLVVIRYRWSCRGLLGRYSPGELGIRSCIEYWFIPCSSPFNNLNVNFPMAEYSRTNKRATSTQRAVSTEIIGQPPATVAIVTCSNSANSLGTFCNIHRTDGIGRGMLYSQLQTISKWEQNLKKSRLKFKALTETRMASS